MNSEERFALRSELHAISAELLLAAPSDIPEDYKPPMSQRACAEFQRVDDKLKLLAWRLGKVAKRL